MGMTTRAVDDALRPAREQRIPDWLSAVLLIALLTLPIVAGAVAQAAGIPLFWPIYFASAVAMAWFFWRLREQPAVVVSAFLFWLMTHKLLVAALAGAASAQSVSWIQNYKELMYPALLVVGFMAGVARGGPGMSRSRLRAAVAWLTWPDILAISLVALVITYFLISFAIDPSALSSQLVYARRFASLPIIFLAGRLLAPSLPHLRRSLRYAVGLAVIVAAFGLVERLLLGDWFWTRLIDVSHLRTSLVDEGFASSRSRLIDGMPANWFTFADGDPVARRLVSTFLEPTTLAIFLAFAIGVGMFALTDWRSTRPIVWTVAMGIATLALLLTIGKAGYLALGIIGMVVVLRATRSNLPLIGLAAVGLAVVGLVVGQFLPNAVNFDRHVAGLMSGLLNLTTDPLGSGLGSTGFWGEDKKIGTDSTLGAVASQLGILGIVLFVAWLATAAWNLLPASRASSEPIRLAMAGAVIALLIVSVFSNSATGLLAGAAFVLFAGWTMTVLASRRTQPDSG